MYKYHVCFWVQNDNGSTFGDCEIFNSNKYLWRDNIDEIRQRIKQKTNATVVVITNIIPLPIINPEELPERGEESYGFEN